ncbi:transmembrane secretion effector [Kribbella sp. VKM Ac-2571]|uniref:MFS transporter n=1 Tax=Kribbella sp. VKM Ac-2571 TaxID=2512222 RepID=UPI0010D66EEB|nr:MFS transporter [Kribbella sp. VKM Ac-2571]TDO56176.1 transmembrane secretion effector [Kribbella sp. VKM Ac-2571]
MSTGTAVGRTLGALRDNRAFRLFWFSNLFFFGGVWTQTLVLGWLAWETTHSDFAVAVYTSVRLAPLLLGPFAGAFADRHNRVRLLIVAASWALVAVSAVATLASLGKAVTSGLRDLARNRLASTVLLITLAANTLLWPVAQSFMPVFAQESLGLDAAGLGWLLTCAGVGGLTGSLVIAWLGDFRFKGGMFVVGTAIWGTLWSLFALSHDTMVSFVLMTAIGVMSAAFGVLQTTLLLMTTDESLHGRALGVQELAIGIMPLASLALGVFAEHYGVGITTFVSAVLLVAAVAALGLWTPKLLRYSGLLENK